MSEFLIFILDFKNVVLLVIEVKFLFNIDFELLNFILLFWYLDEDFDGLYLGSLNIMLDKLFFEEDFDFEINVRFVDSVEFLSIFFDLNVFVG